MGGKVYQTIPPPLYRKMEDISMSLYHFQCIAPVAFMFLAGAVAYGLFIGFWN